MRRDSNEHLRLFLWDQRHNHTVSMPRHTSPHSLIDMRRPSNAVENFRQLKLGTVHIAPRGNVCQRGELLHTVRCCSDTALRLAREGREAGLQVEVEVFGAFTRALREADVRRADDYLSTRPAAAEAEALSEAAKARLYLSNSR